MNELKKDMETAHCLFEQSGTFKNQFKELGITAYDYDIQNEFNETDFQIDIFAHIQQGYNGEPSLFDGIGEDDYVLAFFPCTRFEESVPRLARTQNRGMEKWDDEKRIEYSKGIVEGINTNYQMLCQMCIIAIRKNLKMIIENPYTQPHFLTQFFPLKPQWIDKDRRDRGDTFRKPTQYFFLNCEPKHNSIWEPQYYIPKTKIIERISGTATTSRATERSRIEPEYANRFIREFIL